MAKNITHNPFLPQGSSTLTGSQGAEPLLDLPNAKRKANAQASSPKLSRPQKGNPLLREAQMIRKETKSKGWILEEPFASKNDKPQKKIFKGKGLKDKQIFIYTGSRERAYFPSI